MVSPSLQDWAIARFAGVGGTRLIGCRTHVLLHEAEFNVPSLFLQHDKVRAEFITFLKEDSRL
eukprot:4479831-Amphidinium_carterae.2